MTRQTNGRSWSGNWECNSGRALPSENKTADGFPPFSNRHVEAGCISSPRVTSEKTWRPDAVLMLVSGLLIAMSLAGLGPALVEKLAPRYNASLGDWPKFASTIFVHVCVIIMLQVFLHVHEVSWREFLGLDTPGVGRKLLIGLGSGILVVPLLLGINWAISYLLTHFHGPPVEQQVVTMVKANSDVFLRISLAIAAIVTAPFVEEAVFRGVLYPAIKQRGHRLLALFFTALLFAGVHANLMTFIPLALFAIVLALLYDKTGALLTPMVTHSVFNALNFVLLLNERPIEHFFRRLLERI
ncbi:MAG: Abortive infection protein [Verrucomicrobiales bacterium]|nr:Abortive infection protein [Verrucomicrobiales bacterium]